MLNIFLAKTQFILRSDIEPLVPSVQFLEALKGRSLQVSPDLPENNNYISLAKILD